MEVCKNLDLNDLDGELMKKCKISETESLTYDELKERILSYKHPESSEKFPDIGVCLMCLRRINSQSRVYGFNCCSKECLYMYKIIYGNEKDNVSEEDKNELRKLRKELWEGRGWVSPNKEMDEIKKQMDNGEQIIIFDNLIKNAASACEQIRNNRDTSKHERLSLCIIFMELIGITKSTTVDEMKKSIKDKIERGI